MASVRGIRCVDVAVGNIEHTANFYGGIWGLTEVARSEDARFYRGTHRYHHILGLFDRGRPPCCASFSMPPIAPTSTLYIAR